MKIFNKKLLSLIFALSFLVSCNIKPKKIDYGKDHCTFCDMTVVDKTHASEYVTKKGKSYIFDSVECMVQELNQKDNEKGLQLILVADYSNPGALINAQDATFLICKEIKSPMGANLSALSSKEKALELQKKFNGELLTWEQLKTKFRK